VKDGTDVSRRTQEANVVSGVVDMGGIMGEGHGALDFGFMWEAA
jgi:hypothetical protein